MNYVSALISLASHASPTTLLTTIPSGPDYDGGAESFVPILTKAGKSRKEIEPMVDAAYGDKTLTISKVNQIIKAVKERKMTSD
jgi:hypothetical protein